MFKFDFDAGKDHKLFTSYSQEQVDNINAIVCKCNEYSILLPEQIAYVLATAYHEGYNPRVPNSRITPIKEFGGNAYLKSKKYYPYFGRGFVQLTWFVNYEKEAKRLKIDCVNDPDLVLDRDIAADIIAHGMKVGVFTGKKLVDYISASKKDYKGARRIINGTDRAQDIADLAVKFAKCIKKI